MKSLWLRWTLFAPQLGCRKGHCFPTCLFFILIDIYGEEMSRTLLLQNQIMEEPPRAPLPTPTLLVVGPQKQRNSECIVGHWCSQSCHWIHTGAHNRPYGSQPSNPFITNPRILGGFKEFHCSPPPPTPPPQFPVRCTKRWLLGEERSWEKQRSSIQSAI